MQHPEYLARSTGASEDRHRRLVLFATGVLILLATSPVLAHHIGSRLDQLLAGRDHLWVICVIAVHQLMAPIHEIFHGLLVAGLAYAAWDRGRAWIVVRRLLHAVHAVRPVRGDPFWTAAEEARVPPGLLRVVDGLPNPAFTAGWLRPHIYVATRLADELSPAELRAVVAHEHAHVRRRDPLRLSVLRFVGCALFWLPALRRLAADAADDAEIAADDTAVRGEPLVLASAILKLAAWRVPGHDAGAGGRLLSSGSGVVIGFQRDALLDRRIHRLVGEKAAVVTHVTKRSLAAAFAGLLLVWSSGLAVAHPLPTHAEAGALHGGHCTQHRGWAVEHLFCLAGHSRAPGARCPHDVALGATP
ncbi:MAG: M56 family metallopeptidase [Gemmatimonadota bacterium]